MFFGLDIQVSTFRNITKLFLLVCCLLGLVYFLFFLSPFNIVIPKAPSHLQRTKQQQKGHLSQSFGSRSTSLPSFHMELANIFSFFFLYACSRSRLTLGRIVKASISTLTATLGRYCIIQVGLRCPRMKLTLIYDTHTVREKGGFDGIVKFEWGICKNYFFIRFCFCFYQYSMVRARVSI